MHGGIKAIDRATNQHRDPVDKALWAREPVEDVLCVLRDWTELRNAAQQASSGAQDPVQVPNPAGRKPIIYGATII